MTHWTQGPAKVVAALILGAASIAGMTWSLTTRPPAPAGVEPTAVGPALQQEGTSSPASVRPTLGARINVNSAPAAELQMLPGVGPTLAQRIIDDREANGPYGSIADLQRVRGIGPRTVEKLAEMATVGSGD